jgi:hypothetical protein
MQTELFTIEHEDGEMIDIQGDGGFSAFTSFAEALDAMETEQHSWDVPLKVVRYARA